MKIATLSRLCLRSIADNMAMWCASAVNEDFFKYLYIVGPFNGLNSAIIQQILDISFHKHMLKASYLPLLIHGNLTKLNLSTCHAMVTDQVLKLVALRCKRLTHLNLHRCSRLSSKSLTEAVPSFTLLKSLDLSNCPGCSDHLLYQLNKQCHNIQELSLEACSGVTDAGIQALINDSPSDGLGCFKIHHLNISSTSVTTKSLCFVLDKLQHLKKLSFSNIKYGVEHGSKSSFINDSCPLEVKYLDVSCTYIQDSHLRTISGRCSKLAELKINNTDKLFDGFLDCLASLSHLKSLSIAGISQELTFNHFTKFLAERGRQLEFLDLSGMTGICISVLCFYCRALKELVLADCQDIDLKLPTWDALTAEHQRDCVRAGRKSESLLLNFSGFCQLEYLSFDRATFSANPAELNKLICSLLISHHGLKKLRLQHAPVTDEILLKVLESSSGGNLFELDLSHCQNITMATFETVLQSCQNLRLLDLSHCKRICWRDMFEIENSLKKTGNPLKVHWC